MNNISYWNNRAEKSSGWLRSVGRSIEDGDATFVKANQSCEENNAFSDSYCNPPGINQRRAFLMQSLAIAGEKDILKICRWDFSNSVVNKNGRRVKCQDFCTLTEWPYPGT